MIVLKFDTWEEFDASISGIVKIVTEIAPDPTKNK